MAERAIIWTAVASRQLRAVLSFWIEHNKSNAYSLKLLAKVETHVKSISQSPRSNPLTTFPNTRVAAMKHYSVFYKTNNQGIDILAFWDNRQDPKKLYKLLSKQNPV